MNLDALIDSALMESPDCPDEVIWKEQWQARHLTQADPITMAVHGGALADRFAWVFFAGYQGALRALLGDRMTGCAALVASEDREDPQAHPGTRLSGSDGALCLSGFKSWVAGSRQIEQLIVSARGPDEDKPRTWISIDRDQVGVTLSHRETSRFLPQLSQGFAQFTEVRIDASQVLTGLSVRDFRHVESCHVRLAGVAFLLRLAPQDREVRALLHAFAALCEPGGRLNHDLTERMDACVERLAPQLSALPDYATDQRLLTMYQPAEAQPPRG